jgi:hypothetical protein
MIQRYLLLSLFTVVVKMLCNTVRGGRYKSLSFLGGGDVVVVVFHLASEVCLITNPSALSNHGIPPGKRINRFLLTPYYLTPCDTKSPVLPADVLVDGFVAHTFSPQDAYAFFTLLLRTPDFLQQYGVSCPQEVWYITHIPQNVPYVQQSLLGDPTHNLPRPLDFNVRTTEGTVVPQRRWAPADEVDVRRYVAEAALQLPVFFFNVNGGVGFWLPDILQNRDLGLLNRDSEAPLGGVTTTHIRINVSSHALY